MPVTHSHTLCPSEAVLGQCCMSVPRAWLRVLQTTMDMGCEELSVLYDTAAFLAFATRCQCLSPHSPFNLSNQHCWQWQIPLCVCVGGVFTQISPGLAQIFRNLSITTSIGATSFDGRAVDSYSEILPQTTKIKARERPSLE